MTTRIRCLLLDDELPGLAYLKMLCQQVPNLEVVKAFNDPVQFLYELPQLDFDLCILDIEMPGMNGLEVAASLKGRQVIFTTAYKEYASDAFDLDAADYVRKPIQRERLQQAVEKAAKRLQQPVEQRASATLNTDKGKSILYFSQLCHISTSAIDSRDKVALIDNGSTLTLKNISFEKLRELLPAAQFCRVNKKELIALRCVRSYTSDEITTTLHTPHGQVMKLPLSESFRAEFMSRVNASW